VNAVFFAIIAIAFVVAGLAELTSVAAIGDAARPMQALSKAVVDSAGSAVTLALGLVGVMTLFLGLMKVAEAGGLMAIIAGLIRPLMQRLFPDIPPGHPAMGAMILNIAANILGLGNAATPFGIRAMQQLAAINPFKGTASNAMVLFLAINTSSVTVLPTGVIGLRVAAGSADPAGILPTTLFATICSTTVALVMAKLCARFFPLDAASRARSADSAPAPAASEDDPLGVPAAAPASGDEHLDAPQERRYPAWASIVALAAVAALIPLTIVHGRAIAPWIIPLLVTGLLAFGAVNRVKVYEVCVEGARDGFQVALRILPYLVLILVAIGMFRASGALDLLAKPIGAVTAPLGLPADAVPMALLRPLSGNGAFALLASLLNDPAIGPDSYTGYLVSTIQGSTDTTFYVLAVYFGSVGIRRIRHALLVGLTADAAGVAASVFICSRLYGG
jgi:spore maturation protein SpmA